MFTLPSLPTTTHQATFNALDRDINAILHFPLHFVVNTMGLAAEQSFSVNHPVYQLLTAANNNNAGILAAGLVTLLGGGAFGSDKPVFR